MHDRKVSLKGGLRSVRRQAKLKKEIPTILYIPDRMDTLILEYSDPRGPWGARGVGEVTVMATAPVIISAVYDAIGVRFDQFTLTPDLILRGLGKL